MATLEPKALRRLADAWEAGIDSAEKRSDAATFSGIVGDAAHRLDGGYHISREDQPASNYSVADCAEDRQGPSNLAAALDMNMIDKDMKLVFSRLYKSFKDQNDHRLDHVRGINGTLDNANAIRIDCQFGTEEPSTSDHLWHIHLEVLRAYVEDDATMADILSVILETAGGNDVGTLDGWQGTMLQNTWNVIEGLRGGSETVKQDVGGGVMKDFPLAPIKKLNDLATRVAALEKATGPTDAQVNAQAKKITDLLIASNANGLTAADHAAVRADIKQALREGTAPTAA